MKMIANGIPVNPVIYMGLSRKSTPYKFIFSDFESPLLIRSHGPPSISLFHSILRSLLLLLHLNLNSFLFNLDPVRSFLILS